MAKVKTDTLTVSLDEKVKTIHQEETAYHLGEVIADAIASCGVEQSKGLKPTKLMGWSLKLAAREPLLLDESDFDALRDFVALLPKVNILVIAQAEACFKRAREKVTATDGVKADTPTT